jgi:hypothetical protein
MAYFGSDKCQVKKGLFNCGAPRLGVCQYCARAFCERHGVVMEDGQEVCSRPNCVAKKEDLVLHLEYRSRVDVRNRGKECGIEVCAGTIVSQCTRCQGYFCAVHVQARRDTALENGVRFERWAALCEHCFVRRPIWLKP